MSIKQTSLFLQTFILNLWPVLSVPFHLSVIPSWPYTSSADKWFVFCNFYQLVILYCISLHSIFCSCTYSFVFPYLYMTSRYPRFLSNSIFSDLYLSILICLSVISNTRFVFDVSDLVSVVRIIIGAYYNSSRFADTWSCLLLNVLNISISLDCIIKACYIISFRKISFETLLFLFHIFILVPWSPLSSVAFPFFSYVVAPFLLWLAYVSPANEWLISCIFH